MPQETTTTPRYRDVEIIEPGVIRYVNKNGTRATASLDLLLIHEAWGKVEFEDLADGSGPGQGTHGDWSGIRDSSMGARARMLQRALNALLTE